MLLGRLTRRLVALAAFTPSASSPGPGVVFRWRTSNGDSGCPRTLVDVGVRGAPPTPVEGYLAGSDHPREIALAIEPVFE